MYELFLDSTGQLVSTVCFNKVHAERVEYQKACLCDVDFLGLKEQSPSGHE
jgi:hypothetical protein